MSLRHAQAALLLVFTGLLYLTSLNAPFVYDDFYQIVLNPRLHDLFHLRDVVFCGMRQIRLLLNISYALDWTISGGRPWVFHLTNVLLHLLNGALLFRLLERVLPRRPVVVLTTVALFLVHPLQIQSVTYVMGRVSLLQCTFYLACLDLYLSRGKWSMEACAVLISISLLAKESCALIPLVILAAAFTLGQASLRGLLRGRMILLLATPFLLIPLELLLKDPTPMHGGVVGFDLFPKFQYFLIQGYYHLFGAALLALPARQSIIHEYPHFTAQLAALGALGWSIYAAAVWFAFACRRTRPAAAFFIFFYVLTLAPTNTVLQLVNPFAEYRLYQSNIALFAAVGVFVEWGMAHLRSPRARFAAAALLLAWPAAFNFAEQELWNSREALYRDGLASYPDSYLMHLDLGNSLAEDGRLDEAVAELDRAARLADDQGVKYADGPRYNIALIELRRGRVDAALASLGSIRADHLILGHPAIDYYRLALDLLLRKDDRAGFERVRREAVAFFPDAALPNWR